MDKQEKEELNKNNSDIKNENKVVILNEIKCLLEQVGIHHYEPEVATHLIDYVQKYVLNVIKHTEKYMKHAGRSNVTLEDVNMAIDILNEVEGRRRRLPRKKLMDIAKKYNGTHDMQPLKEVYGLNIPPEGSLIQTNYKLRNPNQQYPVTIPLMDITKRQNQVVTLNSYKNVSSIPTIIRSSAGNVSMNMAMNLTPQRIILKPQIPTPNMAQLNNSVNEEIVRKRIKFDNEYMK